MNLVQRVQNILTKPRETWQAIAGESADAGSIYRGYIAWLAAIPAIAGFIGLSVIGLGGFGTRIRVPLVAGIARMIVGYLLSLAAVYVVALIADALAPTFGGAKNRLNALKLVAYGSTAGFVAGIVGVLPGLAVLGLLVSLYSIYLIYLGLPVLMRCPAERAGSYTAVVCICGLVAVVLMSSLSALFMPTHVLRIGHADDQDVVVRTDQGEVHVDTARARDVAREIASAVAAGAAGSAPTIAPSALQGLLPEAIGELKRRSFEAHSGSAMGFGGTVVEARYGDGQRSLHLSIVDMGSFGGLASVANWAKVTMNDETDGKVEKVYREDDRTVHEEYRKDGSSAQYTVILGNGVLVDCEGHGIGIDEVKRIANDLGLAGIERLKRNPKP